jgi:septum formation protein
MTPRLILASASPRRRELLGYLGLPFDIITSDFDESSISTEGITPAEWVMELAKGKALAVADNVPNPASSNGAPILILGADTTVVLNGEYLNKPEDADDAKRMLRHLSGQTHQVYTGICLVEIKNGIIQPPVTDVAVTDVTFDEIPDAVINAYVATGEPLDKAGAYGIQGKALAFIPKINGDYFNVVGLPLNKLVALLARFGVSVW